MDEDNLAGLLGLGRNALRRGLIGRAGRQNALLIADDRYADLPPPTARPQPGMNWLQAASMAAMPVPPVSDALGMAGDAWMFASRPETRTPANYALAALPLVPAAGGLLAMMSRNVRPSAMGLLARAMPGQSGALGTVDAKLWRGGRAPMDGEFFSRDAEYAKGFDKGDFRQYAIKASKAINLHDTYTPDDVAGVFEAMRRDGDNAAADDIEKAVREDGGVDGGMLYMMVERLGKAAPERYLRAAGIQAIDTGRDVRLLDPKAASWD